MVNHLFYIALLLYLFPVTLASQEYEYLFIGETCLAMEEKINKDPKMGDSLTMSDIEDCAQEDFLDYIHFNSRLTAPSFEELMNVNYFDLDEEYILVTVQFNVRNSDGCAIEPRIIESNTAEEKYHTEAIRLIDELPCQWSIFDENGLVLFKDDLVVEARVPVPFSK